MSNTSWIVLCILFQSIVFGSLIYIALRPQAHKRYKKRRTKLQMQELRRNSGPAPMPRVSQKEIDTWMEEYTTTPIKPVEVKLPEPEKKENRGWPKGKKR